MNSAAGPMWRGALILGGSEGGRGCRIVPVRVGGVEGNRMVMRVEEDPDRKGRGVIISPCDVMVLPA